MSFLEGDRPLPEEVVVAQGLKRVILGDPFTGQVGDWDFFEMADSDILAIDYIAQGEGRRVSYGFRVNVPPDGMITLDNYEREAQVKGEGLGTTSLGSLERCLSLVARDLNRDIRIIFSDVVGQPRVAKWLVDRGYKSERNLNPRRKGFYKHIQGNSQ